jgi:hypothetical protein
LQPDHLQAHHHFSTLAFNHKPDSGGLWLAALPFEVGADASGGRAVEKVKKIIKLTPQQVAG